MACSDRIVVVVRVVARSRKRKKEEAEKSESRIGSYIAAKSSCQHDRLSEVEVDPDCADGHGILEQNDPKWKHVTWHNIKPYTRYRFKRAHNLLGYYSFPYES